MFDALTFQSASIYSLLPLNNFQVELEKHGFGLQNAGNTQKMQQTKSVPKSRFGDVGMEFRDVGCVRISFATNSNPFSANPD